ncbi:MAG: STAS domain-containing protein [Lachnospiraceae bacterium]|nr:STAS domain-containing protein [Lachnospiraceae bacterium]
MTIKKEINGKEAILYIEGWLDTQAAPDVEKAVNDLPGEVDTLIIDMEKTEYISSSGMRQIVSAHKKMNGNFSLRNVSADVLDVLRLTGLDKRIHVE